MRRIPKYVLLGVGLLGWAEVARQLITLTMLFRTPVSTAASWGGFTIGRGEIAWFVFCVVVAFGSTVAFVWRVRTTDAPPSS